MIAKCHCGNCGGRLEFEAEDFTPGTVIPCPHCSHPTPLYLLAQTEARIAARRPTWLRWVLAGGGILLLAGLAVYVAVRLSRYPPETVGAWIIGTMWIALFIVAVLVLIMWIIFPILVYFGMQRHERGPRNIEKNTRA